MNQGPMGPGPIHRSGSQVAGRRSQVADSSYGVEAAKPPIFDLKSSTCNLQPASTLSMASGTSKTRTLGSMP
jgi:hypothetical protein